MRTRSSLLAMVCGAALVSGVACSNSEVTSPTGVAPALTALPRDLSAAERGVLSSANAFSMALWRQVNTGQRDSNVFVSPLSASFSLGMTVDGASGATLDELKNGLQLGSLPVSDILTGYKSLIALLTSLDPSTTMSIANSIWYRNTFPFNQNFLDDGIGYFGAAIKPLSFSDVAGSLNAINSWVNTQTKGKIPTILDNIDGNDEMFLINAIYFKGTWRTRFDPTLTQDAAFHAVPGDQSARLMHREGMMSYTSTSTYQAVDLPYGDSAFTMTVVLPATGRSVESLADSLTAAGWQALVAGLRASDVDLYLPRVAMSWKRELIPDLQSLGVSTPFSDFADFSRMSSLGKQLSLSSVRQKTFVSIDEEGTEAAAVTSTGVHVTSAPVVTTMRVDQPYIFVIRERLSGTIIFMGKIVRLP